MRLPRGAAFIGLTALLVSACGPLSGPVLDTMQAMPPPPSPELREQRNRLDVHYRLNAPATVSSRIVGVDGRQWPIASQAERPTPGEYVLQFDGTVAGPGPNERRVLPDGTYQVVLDVDGGGQHVQREVSLVVRDADTRVPDVTDLALLPDRTQARNSKLDGWVEIGPFELATFRRPTEKTSPQLMRVRALQQDRNDPLRRRRMRYADLQRYGVGRRTARGGRRDADAMRAQGVEDRCAHL